MPIQSPDQPLKILIVSSEAVPFAKTGGLADVVGALSLEFAKLGHEVYLIIPRYPFANLSEYASEEFDRFSVPTPMGPIETVVERVTRPVNRQVAGSLTVLTIRCERFFDRDGLYQEKGQDYPDNLERFSYFCRAAMELLQVLASRNKWKPAVMHLHDWQTALCAVYLKTLYSSHMDLADVRCVLTMHNIGYQGLFPGTEYWKIGLPSVLFSMSSLEYYGSINLLKGGIVFADFLTTVSPTYSAEIQNGECGFGLEGVLSERRAFLSGIVNGIDTEIWNPRTDPFLESHYSAANLQGKKQCKLQLQQEMRLEQTNAFLIGVIARLTSQKGLDLVLQIESELMEMDIQLIVLGTGELTYIERFRTLSKQYPKRVAFRDVFDEPLAHRIEAGADLLLMPSRYEPCGLSQLYSLRYGTVPLVRKTGGLADTVVPCTPRNLKERRATGFMFTEPSPDALLSVLMLATAMYHKRSIWLTIMRSGMKVDNSWNRS
ncbi:MAG TPA: glycogen synthase GlgA, partial [Nitrospiraceae bacterium]|nr:glycogen synthase GlgA [Nitrospiraceae bacterium]